MLELAAAAGICTIDTARSYGDSEALVGLLTRRDRRWQVLTKLAPGVTAPGGSSSDAVEAARQSLDSSRKALQRDQLDAVLLHRAEHRTAHGGAIWRLLIEQRGFGRIGKIGVSADSPEEAFDVLDDPEVDAVQVATSLLDQRLTRAGFFVRSKNRGIHVFVRSVFLQGVAHLAPNELPPHLSDFGPVLASILEWAAEHRLGPGAPYVHFARLLPASVLIGVESCGQLAEDLTSWRGPAPQMDEFQALVDSIPNFGAELLTPSRWPRAHGL